MYEVVGFKRSEFQAKDNGQTISGWNIYVECEDPKVTGYRAESIYLSDGKCDYKPQVGDRINVYYNRYGKVDNIQRM